MSCFKLELINPLTRSVNVNALRLALDLRWCWPRRQSFHLSCYIRCTHPPQFTCYEFPSRCQCTWCAHSLYIMTLFVQMWNCFTFDHHLRSVSLTFHAMTTLIPREYQFWSWRNNVKSIGQSSTKLFISKLGNRFPTIYMVPPQYTLHHTVDFAFHGFLRNHFRSVYSLLFSEWYTDTRCFGYLQKWHYLRARAEDDVLWREGYLHGVHWPVYPSQSIRRLCNHASMPERNACSVKFRHLMNMLRHSLQGEMSIFTELEYCYVWSALGYVEQTEQGGVKQFNKEIN